MLRTTFPSEGSMQQMRSVFLSASHIFFPSKVSPVVYDPGVLKDLTISPVYPRRSKGNKTGNRARVIIRFFILLGFTANGYYVTTANISDFI